MSRASFESCSEAGVTDGCVAGKDAIALQALVVCAGNLVQSGQRAREAHIVIDGHPRVVAGALVVKEVPRPWVL